MTSRAPAATWSELGQFVVVGMVVNVGLALTWYWRPTWLDGRHEAVGWTVTWAGCLLLLSLYAQYRHRLRSE